MTRLYLDSNIFRYIKSNHRSFNPQLLKLMNELKDKSLFIFSDAHLDDLRNSSPEYKQQDLLLMGNYVKDNFFTRNPISKVVSCELLTPIQADEQIDHAAYKKAIDKPFDFNELFNNLDETPEGKIAKQLIDSVFNQPLSSLGSTMDTSLLNESNRGTFDKMFPGYHPNMTLKDFMTSISPFTASLFKDTSQVSELRKEVEKYMASDNYSFQVWGMNFNEKVKERFGKTFLETVDGMLLEDQKRDFYLRFHYAYTLLEMYNITQEKIGGKVKKFNFTSLTNDAVHAYFGSMCDYLITDDKGLQVKAAILYELFGVDTKILSSSDFVANYESFLIPQETHGEFSNALKYNIENSIVVSTESIIENHSLITNYLLKNPMLNFFKMMRITQESEWIQIILSLGRYWNNGMLMTREIELIVNKCNLIFGDDDEGKGKFDLNEKIDSGSIIRSWASQTIRLGVTKESGNFYVDLILYILPNKQDPN